MSIPLVQDNEKDSINTSIIAIKRNIERINMLLGLVDNDSPDLSGFATKQELQDAVTELQPVDEVTVGNMQSVTSNAVARAGSYTADEHFTGRYWKNGRKIFEKTIYMGVAYFSSVPHGISNLDFVIFLGGTSPANNGQTRPIPFVFYGNTEWSCGVGCDSANVFIEAGALFCNYHSTAEITMLYTKTTD